MRIEIQANDRLRPWLVWAQMTGSIGFHTADRYPQVSLDSGIRAVHSTQCERVQEARCLREARKVRKLVSSTGTRKPRFWRRKAVLLEVCAISGILQGGFYFHPTDEDLSVGTPEMKKPLSNFALFYTSRRTAIGDLGESEESISYLESTSQQTSTPAASTNSKLRVLGNLSSRVNFSAQCCT